MTADHWALTLSALLGEPCPMPADLPGVVHVCRDEPLPEAELAAITEPRELALCAGISKYAATVRLQQRAEMAQKEPTP